MSLTRAESAALPREQQIATLKEAKGGTWHDDWAPYCMVCTSMARMTERDYGFECRCCRNQIGGDLCRLTDSPLNEAKPAEGGSSRDTQDLLRILSMAAPGLACLEAGVQGLLRDPDFTTAESLVMAQPKPIRQVIVVGHTGDFPFARRKPGEGLTMSPGMKQLATLIKPPSKTDPWAKGNGGKGKRRPLFRR